MKITLNFIVLLMFAGIMQAQVSAKLIQTPDVSETHICFTFGDDLWIVAKAGGNATRLSSEASWAKTRRMSKRLPF